MTRIIVRTVQARVDEGARQRSNALIARKESVRCHIEQLLQLQASNVGHLVVTVGRYPRCT